MFSNLQLKSKIILLFAFLLICLSSGFGIFAVLNNTFSDKIQSYNHKESKMQEEKKDETMMSNQMQTDEKTDKTIISNKMQTNQEENDIESNSIISVSPINTDVDRYISNSYKAGTDIKQGIYKIVTTQDNISGQYIISTNDKEDINFYNGNLFFNFRYIELKDGETVYLVDADIISEDNNQKYSDNNYVSGQYKVGFDIQEGNYRLIPTNQVGYVEISKSPLGDILFSKYIDKSMDIELKQGQYITISGIDITK